MNPFALATVPLLYKWVITAIMRTCTVRTEGAAPIRDLEGRGRPWVYCSWHNNTAIAVCRLRNRRVAMMASVSADGELIARAIERLGNVPIRGSSSFRGGQAARDMVRALRAGSCGGMTPDGPRGPAYRCQTGALWISALSGCPLVPYELNARRQWRIRSWDRHKIPKPFTTIFEYFGEPFQVSRAQLREDEAGVRETFESLMLANTRACLTAAGHDGELPPPP